MKLTVIGSGGSIMSKSRSYPAYLVNDEILLDCGEGTTQKLLQLEVIDGIKLICLTHLHNDHFMGLFSLLWYYWLNGSKESITILGPPNTKKTVEKIMKLTHTPSDMGDFGIEYIELENTNEIQESNRVCQIKARKMEHSPLSFGYRVEDGDSALTYSGDTAPNQGLIDLAGESDVLICESTFPDDLQTKAHTYNHSTPSDAAEIAQKSHVKKLVLVHISAVFEDLIPKMKQAAAEKFQGEILIAKDLITERF